jgi:acetyl-CoA carboxylase biotin carboxyl carrier protein
MGKERFDRDDFAQLRTLIQVVCCSSVTEFELVHRDLRVFVKRREGTALAPSCSPAGQVVPADELTEPECDVEERPVVAPLAGTVYLRPSPTDKPYVEEGDLVEEGQVVALIEAMKMFNEVQAEASGRVMRLSVSNGQSVAAGNPIMVIVPCQRPTPCY